MKTPSAGAPGRAIPLTFVEGAEPEVFACGCGAQPARQRRRSAARRIMARTLSRPDSGSSLRDRDEDREARPQPAPSRTTMEVPSNRAAKRAIPLRPLAASAASGPGSGYPRATLALARSEKLPVPLALRALTIYGSVP